MRGLSFLFKKPVIAHAGTVFGRGSMGIRRCGAASAPSMDPAGNEVGFRKTMPGQ
jgi:hypothetical protein